MSASARAARCWLTTCAVVAVWAVSASAAAGEDPSQEFWPEIDTWWRLSPAWRLSLFVPVSENLETHYREGNVIPQVDFAWGKTSRRRRLMDEDRARTMKFFMVRGGYLGGKSLDDQGEAYTERTIFSEFHVRIPIKGGFMISHRLRGDLRWLGEEDADFSNRWRYRLMVERDLMAGRVSFVPFANGEAYYDSRYDTVNRVRLIAGTSVGWSRYYAIETNATYQHDSRSSVAEILALNVILHVFFDTSRARSGQD